MDNKISIHSGENKGNFASKFERKNVNTPNLKYRYIQIKQNYKVKYFGCFMDETLPGEFMAFNVMNKIRQAVDVRSLPLSCKEIAQVMLKCQISISLNKILTCYLIQVYTLK